MDQNKGGVVTKALAKRQTNLERAATLGAAAYSPKTIEAYRSQIKSWLTWCRDYDVRPCPAAPEHLAEYIGAMDSGGYAAGTIRQHCAAIKRMHRDPPTKLAPKDGGSWPNPFDHQELRDILKGLHRTRPGPKGKKPLTAEILRAALPNLGIRDQTILVVGCVTGLRRSELVVALWDDLESVGGGYALHVPKAKTGTDQLVGIPKSKGKWCPVRLLDAWWAVAPDVPRIFPLSTATVNRIVKGAATLAGEDPAEYGAHSMRAALATIAGEQGVQLAVSMIATRHKSANVAAGYVRKSEAVKNPAHAAVVEALG